MIGQTFFFSIISFLQASLFFGQHRVILLFQIYIYIYFFFFRNTYSKRQMIENIYINIYKIYILLNESISPFFWQRLSWKKASTYLLEKKRKRKSSSEPPPNSSHGVPYSATWIPELPYSQMLVTKPIINTGLKTHVLQ